MTTTKTLSPAITPADFERRALEYHGSSFDWDALAERAENRADGESAARYRERAAAARVTADKFRALAELARKVQSSAEALR